MSARNFKKAASLILELHHSPSNYPQVVESLERSTVAYYLSRYEKH